MDTDTNHITIAPNRAQVVVAFAHKRGGRSDLKFSLEALKQQSRNASSAKTKINARVPALSSRLSVWHPLAGVQQATVHVFEATLLNGRVQRIRPTGHPGDSWRACLRIARCHWPDYLRARPCLGLLFEVRARVCNHKPGKAEWTAQIPMPQGGFVRLDSTASSAAAASALCKT
jgi:hypothetical protein